MKVFSAKFGSVAQHKGAICERFLTKIVFFCERFSLKSFLLYGPPEKCWVELQTGQMFTCTYMNQTAIAEQYKYMPFRSLCKKKILTYAVASHVHRPRPAFHLRAGRAWEWGYTCTVAITSSPQASQQNLLLWQWLLRHQSFSRPQLFTYVLLPFIHLFYLLKLQTCTTAVSGIIQYSQWVWFAEEDATIHPLLANLSALRKLEVNQATTAIPHYPHCTARCVVCTVHCKFIGWHCQTNFAPGVW